MAFVKKVGRNIYVFEAEGSKLPVDILKNSTIAQDKGFFALVCSGNGILVGFYDPKAFKSCPVCNKRIIYEDLVVLLEDNRHVFHFACLDKLNNNINNTMAIRAVNNL
jgi:hypothetical protein